MKESMRETLRHYERERRRFEQQQQQQQQRPAHSRTTASPSASTLATSSPSRSHTATTTLAHGSSRRTDNPKANANATSGSANGIGRRPVGSSEDADRRGRRLAEGVASSSQSRSGGRKEQGKGGGERGDRKPSSAGATASTGRHHGSRSASRTDGSRSNVIVHKYTKYTAYEHEDTPDDIDLLVSKVTEKFAKWNKDLSERAVEAREKKMEESQRKQREALKKAISYPMPAEVRASTESGATNRMPGSKASSSPRPSFGGDGSARPALGRKTGGSMAERMAKRGGFEVPFWPAKKKDKSAAPTTTPRSSHEAHRYDGRGSQTDGSVDQSVAAAPWNRHVTKSSPFTAGRGSIDKERSSAHSSPTTFFGKLLPSPASLLSSGSRNHSPHAQRRGSGDSFFGCCGITVDEERAAQHVNHQARSDVQLESADFRPPLTPISGRRDMSAAYSSGSDDFYLGKSGGSGRMPWACADDEDDADDNYSIDSYYYGGGERASSRLKSAQHRPDARGGEGVSRRGMAAEVVDRRPREAGDRRRARGRRP